MHSLSYGAIMRDEFLMYFCIKKVCRQLIFFNLPPHPPVVCATDRSKAVVPVLFLFCVVLWLKLLDASWFKVILYSLSSLIPFSIVITSVGEEGAGRCASGAFVYLFCTC